MDGREVYHHRREYDQVYGQGGRAISYVQCMPAKPIKHGIKVDLTPVKKLGKGSK